ncbi:hypothetical protein [Prevotella pallens]|nr:hypothetical protein [Prevotella pallens]
MNLPLRLTECSQPISWWTWGIDGVFRNQFRGGRGELRGVSQPIS